MKVEKEITIKLAPDEDAEAEYAIDIMDHLAMCFNDNGLEDIASKLCEASSIIHLIREGRHLG